MSLLSDYIPAFAHYRRTTHGDNPWTPEALGHVMAYRRYFDAARHALDGKITSCYRSKRVNKIIGGHPRSRHLRGLAVDITCERPVLESGWDLWERACNAPTKFGPIRKVIVEPYWLHISWYSPREVLRGEDGIKLLQRRPGEKTYTLLR